MVTNNVTYIMANSQIPYVRVVLGRNAHVRAKFARNATACTSEGATLNLASEFGFG